MTLLSHIYRSLSRTIKSPPHTYCFSSSSSASSYLLTQQHLRMPSISDFVDGKIATHKIVVFSKTYCPFCKQTKQYFQDNHPQETVEVVELDTRDDTDAIQDYLKVKTGARSVPRTFINGESVGGNDALHAKPKPEVAALIAKSR
ncbi:Thioredoxin-like fold [Tylopilus felleus]